MCERLLAAAWHHKPTRNVTLIRPPWMALVMLMFGVILMSEPHVSASGFTFEDQVVVVGRGSYTTALPRGRAGPPGRIFRTPALTGPMPTNTWWSSAAFLPLSESMYAHPLAFRATQQGLGLSYPPMRVRGGSNPSFFANYRQDLILSLSGLHVQEALVAGYSDWTVDLLFEAGKRRLMTRIGHGFPYAYATFSGAAPVVIFPSGVSVWSSQQGGSVLGVTVNGNPYGLFCPSGGRWVRESAYRLRCEVPLDTGHVSVGILPSADDETLALFARHAFAVPATTTVDWSYNAATSEVHTTYRVDTEPVEGDEDRVLLALYPHQWKYTPTPLTDYTYTSPRGPMRLLVGNQFVTVHRYPGLLPYLPALPATDREMLRDLLHTAVAQELWPPGLGTGDHDTYWTGKSLGRVAQSIPLAKELGEEQIVGKLIKELREQLEDWFTVDPGESKRFFYYDQHWGTLIGYPASHGTDTELNDHHFHYGYFIGAAAMVALHDTEWAAEANWGGMVDLLIRDWASHSRHDELFPFLRTFDPYAGHSWASGTATMSEGNNQESSSEAIHAWASLVLYGEATGNTELRDLGIWGYTLESHAARLYWLGVEPELFPSGYTPPILGRLFGSGGDCNTWWTGEKTAVHAINILPVTTATLHLGSDPESVVRNYQWLTRDGQPNGWTDIIHSYLALADPDTAMEAVSRPYTPEFGESKAHTYHWIRNLQELGQVDSTVWADHPLYAVFVRDGVRTYLAFNASNDSIVVRFSDGVQLEVAPHSMAMVRH